MGTPPRRRAVTDPDSEASDVYPGRRQTFGDGSFSAAGKQRWSRE